MFEFRWTGQALVGVPLSLSYQRLSDPEEWMGRVSSLDSVSVDTDRGTQRFISYRFDLPGKAIAFTLQHTLHRPHQIHWKLASGDGMVKNEGRWVLEEFPSQQTRISFELDFEGELPVPAFLAERMWKGMVEKTFREIVSVVQDAPGSHQGGSGWTLD